MHSLPAAQTAPLALLSEMQAPAEQILPPEQTTPQAPQWIMLVYRFVSQPFARIRSQSAHPELQAHLPVVMLQNWLARQSASAPHSPGASVGVGVGAGVGVPVGAGVTGMEQSTPDQPVVQMHTPATHVPWALQPGGHEGVGVPLGVGPIEQATPDHPVVQVHTPATQVPWVLQPGGQAGVAVAVGVSPPVRPEMLMQPLKTKTRSMEVANKTYFVASMAKCSRGGYLNV